MKYALIGCGRISPNHIVAAKNNGLEIAAICDVDVKCMEDKVKKFTLPASVKKYTEIYPARVGKEIHRLPRAA